MIDYGANASLVERAARYLSYGWALVPLAPRGKEPHFELLRDIYRDTRLDHLRRAPAFPEEVEYWFENDPDINLAVIPPASGIVVADIDRPDVLDADFQTPTVRSGRLGGGMHLYFRSDEPVARAKTDWGDLNPSYVVLPGSTHPRGGIYEWQPGRAPGEVPFLNFSEAAPALGIEG